MSEPTWYSTDKIVKSFTPTGQEILPDDQDRWHLYHAVETAITKQAKVFDGSVKTAEEEGKAAPPPTPQRIIDKLFEARGDMDVVLDLINSIQQQQFLTIAYAPKSNTSQDADRERALKLAARSAHLQATAERLKKGAAALTKQCHVDAVFIEEVGQIRKHWKVQRTPGGMLFVDLALPLHLSSNDPGTLGGMGPINTTSSSIGVTRFNLVPDAQGAACIVLPSHVAASELSSSGGGGRGGDGRGRQPVVAVKGWRDVHAALTGQHQVLMWQMVAHLIDLQSREININKEIHSADNAASSTTKRSNGPSSTSHQTALLRDVLLQMASVAVAKSRRALSEILTAQQKQRRMKEQQQQEEEEAATTTTTTITQPSAMDIDSLTNNSPPATAATKLQEVDTNNNTKDYIRVSSTLPWMQSENCRNILKFAASGSGQAQVHFEVHALRCLADMLELHAVPAVLLDIQGRSRTDVNMFKKLKEWLMHASGCN